MCCEGCRMCVSHSMCIRPPHASLSFQQFDKSAYVACGVWHTEHGVVFYSACHHSSLHPLGKAHGTARTGWRTVARHVVNKPHLQVLDSASGGDPVTDLRISRIQTLLREGGQGRSIFVLHGG